MAGKSAPPPEANALNRVSVLCARAAEDASQSCFSRTVSTAQETEIGIAPSQVGANASLLVSVLHAHPTEHTCNFYVVYYNIKIHNTIQ